MRLAGRIFETIKGLALPPRAPRRLTLGEALPRLVPKVRPRFLFESLALGGAEEGPVFRPLAGIFAQSLVVDAPEWEVDVGPRDLASWGADFDALFQKARANLVQRGGEEGFEEVRPGLFRSTWQDNLDGSRVVLPGVLRRLPLRGDPVVVLPNRDNLLVAGSEDPRALCWILEAALEFMWGDPKALNGCPLRLRGFQWEPWEVPDEAHPAARLLGRVRRRRMVEEYTRQKSLLDRLHGREGRAVSVAPYHLEKTASGAVRSCTFLPQGGQEGWLPKADQVGLLREGRTCLWIPWEAAMDHLGPLLEPLGLFPERYRIRCPEALTSFSWTELRQPS